MEKIRAHIDEVKKKPGATEDPGDSDEIWPLSISDKRGNSRSHEGRRLKKGDNSLLATLPRKDANKIIRLLVANTSLVNTDARKSPRNPTLRNHAIRAGQQGSYSADQIECRKSIEQFVRDSYQSTLARQPSSSELSTWTNTLIQAQSQGQAQLLSSAQSLEYALFQSQEYATRARSDVDFIYDLYKAFLQREPDQGGWDFWVGILQSYPRSALIDAFATCAEFSNFVVSLCIAGTFDADGDQLSDSFESQLADEFTPKYHVSTNEPDHFARFGDYVPETVTQTFSPYQPISHYRVTPLLIAGGVGYLRVDYMTLWDHDGGLQFGALCNADLILLSGTLGSDIINFIALTLQQLSAHNLDNERSAILVAAPVGADGLYNTNAAAYNAYSFFLSAHEGTAGDQSIILYPPQPIAPGGFSHINLTLTRSKHATYAFDPYYPSFPNGLPLIPWEVIFLSYDTVDFLYAFGYISFFEYLAALFALDNLFYACAIEHFSDSGGTYAETPARINVGEVSQPINGSHFIQGGELYQQLTTPIPW